MTVIKPGARERERERERDRQKERERERVDCLDPSGPHLETVTCPEAAAYQSKESVRGLQPNRVTFTLGAIALCFCHFSSPSALIFIDVHQKVPIPFPSLHVYSAQSDVCQYVCPFKVFFVCVCLQLSPHLPVVYIISRFQSFHIFGTPHESAGPITHPGPCKILAACRVFPWGLEVNTSLEDDFSWVRVVNSSLGF